MAKTTLLRSPLDLAQLEKLALDYALLNWAPHRQAKPRPLTKTAVAKAKQFVLGMLQHANKKDGFIKARYARGKLAGCYFANIGESMAPGVKNQFFTFALTPAAKVWFAAELKKIRLKKGCDVLVTYGERKTIPLLLRHGCAVESVVLKGKPQTALRGLLKNRTVPPNLNHLGLKLRKMEATHIGAVINIFKREFARNPQFGSFVALPSYLKKRREELLESIKSRECSQTVIVNSKNKVVGYFGVHANFGKKLSDRRAGNEIILDQSVQGLGIAKTAYYLMLKWMVANRIQTFQGGTAQPAVMGLSKDMGRWVDVYFLKKGKGYFPAHFFPGLEELKP